MKRARLADVGWIATGIEEFTNHADSHLRQAWQNWRTILERPYSLTLPEWVVRLAAMTMSFLRFGDLYDDVVAKIDSPSENAQRLLSIISAAIDLGELQKEKPETFLTYSTALRRLGFANWGHAGGALGKAGLSELSGWTEHYVDLPKVDSLIVSKKSYLPGSGFLKAHGFTDWNDDSRSWWLAESSKSIDFDWKPFLTDKLSLHPTSARHGGKGLVREDEIEEPALHGNIVTAPPGPARIRNTRITVADILQWLAMGKSEDQILGANSALDLTDIRASFAYAAERERKAGKPTFTERWAGKFQLREPDSEDAKLTYLLERYERNRK